MKETHEDSKVESKHLWMQSNSLICSLLKKTAFDHDDEDEDDSIFMIHYDDDTINENI